MKNKRIVTNIFITYISFFYRVLLNPGNDRNTRGISICIGNTVKIFCLSFLCKSPNHIYINVVRTLVRIGCKRTKVRATIATLKFLNVNVNLRDEQGFTGNVWVASLVELQILRASELKDH